MQKELGVQFQERKWKRTLDKEVDVEPAWDFTIATKRVMKFHASKAPNQLGNKYNWQWQEVHLSMAQLHVSGSRCCVGKMRPRLQRNMMTCSDDWAKWKSEILGPRKLPARSRKRQSLWCTRTWQEGYVVSTPYQIHDRKPPEHTEQVSPRHLIW